MKKKIFTLMTLALLSIGSAWAVDPITVTWLPNNMASETMAGTTSVSDILTVSDITLASDVETTGTLGTWDSKKWVVFTSKTVSTAAGPKNGINKNDYLTFTVTVKSGYKFTPTGITAYAVGSGTGNNGVGIFTETVASNVSSGYTATNSSSAATAAQLTKAVTSPTLSEGATYTFYVYFSQNNTSSGKGVGVRDVVLTGSYASASAPTIVSSDATVKATASGVEATSAIAVSGENLAGSKLTATLSPAVAGLSVTLASDDITAGAISTTATLHYTATENTSGSTTLTISDGTTSEDFTVNYSSLIDIKSISGATTFDFSKVGTELATVTPDDYVILANAGSSASFAENVAVKGVGTLNVTWRSDAVQAGYFKFNTTVPGIVTLKWSDTGGTAGGERAPRYANVNGTISDVYSNGSGGTGAQVTCSPIPVNAGEVIIKGYQYNSGDDNYTDNQIRVFQVVFTPTIEKTITSAEYATFVPSDKVSVPAGVKAYIVTATDATTATLSADDAITVIPANTPVVIKGDEGTYYFPKTTADPSDVTGNKLTTGATTADGTQYILANGGSGVGFYKATPETEIAAGVAYLVSPSGSAPYFIFGIEGGTTGIDSVQGSEFTVNGEYYNLAGQRVAQPTKGLYIVNGKKVVVK